MSHFVVLVMTENGEEFEVEELLAPYDENIQVAPYKQDCYCIGREAYRVAVKQANERVGTIDSISTAFYAQEDVKQLQVQGDAKGLLILWQAAIFQWQACVEKAEREHPLYNKPDPICECKGTGKELVKYNPNSKWDWYRIGGRWDGEILGEEREFGDGGFNFDHGYDEIENNSKKVRELVNYDGDGNVYYPYAIVTPTGEWFEKGEIDSNVKDNWKEIVDKLYKEYPEYVGVAVDCHI